MVGIKDIFKNNGKARGWLYVLIPAAAFLTEKFTAWSETPPDSPWTYAAAFTAMVVASGTALRAYLDQHLSNQKQDPPNNA